MFVRVCVRARVCVCMCVYVCVRACVRACVAGAGGVRERTFVCGMLVFVKGGFRYVRVNVCMRAHACACVYGLVHTACHKATSDKSTNAISCIIAVVTAHYLILLWWPWSRKMSITYVVHNEQRFHTRIHCSSLVLPRNSRCLRTS